MSTTPLLPSSARLCPLFLSSVKAGFPSPADDYLEAGLDLNTYLIKHPSATFFVRVSGDSMIGAGIRSGDMLIIDRSLEPLNNDIILAILDGGFTVKRWRKLGARVFLLPENPSYQSIEVGAEQDFEIWGVVIHVIHSCRKP
jgi:DNA polymerase V